MANKYLKICISIFACGIIMLPVACGSSPLEDHASLGFYGTPDEIIKKLEQTNKDAGQYFMLGQAFKDQKQHKKALLYFANSCFASHKNEQLTLYPMPVYSYVTSFRRKSAYYEDALYEIALIMYSYQEYGYTEKFLKKIGKSNLGLHVDAQILLSRALQAQKKENEAFDILSDEISAAPNNPTLLKLLIRRASLYESIDDYGMAAADYSLIIEKDMKSWQAGLSAANLYRLAGKAGLDTNETLLLAKGLYIAKKHKEAQDILTSLKKDEQADKKTVNEYTLRVLTNLGPDAEAQKAAKEIPDGQQIMADELWLSGKRDKAVQVYRDTLKNNVTEKALYRTALYMSDRNRSGYSSFLELYIKNFPDAENAGQMLWLLARSRIENGQTNEAEKLLGKYTEKFPEGKYSDQCRFWLNKIYTAAGSGKQAEEMAFRLVCINPDSPYTFLLLERAAEKITANDIRSLLQKTDKNSDARIYYHSLLFVKEKNMAEREKRIPSLSAASVRDNRLVEDSLQNAASGKYKTKQLQNLEKYMSIGYTEGIERVTGILPDADTADIEKAAALAHLGGKYSYPFYSVYYGQQLLKSLSVRENIFILPQKFIAMILPSPFAEEVKQSCDRYKTDPNSVYSLIKAESLFNHKAKSSAGAIGLMQLMPPTAGEIAKNSGMAQYDLKKPEDSIRFGSYYLGWLKGYYKNNFIYMVAAYNAGAGNVNKWIKKIGDTDPDYFTEFVAFTETRYYILRTGKFVRQYSIINGS